MIQDIFLAERARENENLKVQARTAMAWGRPDQESIGYSPREFIQIIHKMLKRIEELERALKELT